MRIGWLEVGVHPGLGYYDAIQEPLRRLGHQILELRAPAHGFPPNALRASLADKDVALVGFGWFAQERPPVRYIPEFLHCEESNVTSGVFASTRKCKDDNLCHAIPLVAILNKEYVLMKEKLAWMRAHCVAAALTVHHDASLFARQTQVPFHRIWFGVNASAFSASSADVADGSENHRYQYDLGFTGVVRAEQTANWRYRIWRHAWPVLSQRGLRLFSGGRGGVHVGVAHAVSRHTAQPLRS